MSLKRFRNSNESENRIKTYWQHNKEMARVFPTFRQKSNKIVPVFCTFVSSCVSPLSISAPETVSIFLIVVL